jgi:predicted DNA-binding transcriptional regulator AlpA
MRPKKILLLNLDYDTILTDFKKLLQEEYRAPPKEKFPDLVPINETARLFQISQKTLYNWSKKNLLKRVEIGNRVFYERAEILDFVERNKF